MNKLIDFQIFPTENLIVDYLAGDIYLKDVLAMKKKQIEDVFFDPEFAFIVDIRDAVLRFSEEDLDTYVSFLETEDTIIGNRRTAYITHTAEQVTTTSIYLLKGTKLPMKTLIVSSLSAAFRWTGMNMQRIDSVSELLNAYREKHFNFELD